MKDLASLIDSMIDFLFVRDPFELPLFYLLPSSFFSTCFFGICGEFLHIGGNIWPFNSLLFSSLLLLLLLGK